MDASAKYQLTIPFTLQRASPALAALHASRFLLLNPSQAECLKPTYCSRCGSFEPQIRLYRTRKRTKGNDGQRVVRSSCGACGFEDNAVACRGNAILFPMTGKVSSQRTQMNTISSEVMNPRTRAYYPFYI
jgi:hypothetical protein